MDIRLLTEHHLEFLSLKGGCTGSSESILVRMPHWWKAHVAAHMLFAYYRYNLNMISLYLLSIMSLFECHYDVSISVINPPANIYSTEMVVEV